MFAGIFGLRLRPRIAFVCLCVCMGCGDGEYLWFAEFLMKVFASAEV